MAFQQQQPRPQLTRQISTPRHHHNQSEQQSQNSPSRQRQLEESQEWILFSPQHDVQSIGTSQTPRTATQPSDFGGSLETHVRSQPLGSQDNDDSGTCLGTEFDEEGAELDSLDDGLHAFHNPFAPSSNNLDQSGGAVLPTHDGLGTFLPSSAGLQEQLWQFERHNPHNRRRQHVRRRSSVQRRLDALEEEQDFAVDDERTARIEKWRLDQSRAVLEEIERETRRQRRRMGRMSNATDVRPVLEQTALERILTRQDSAVREEKISQDDSPQGESFWRRITRKVIQDLIGLNDTTLSVIFGEQLSDDASPTPTQPSPIAAAAARHHSRVSFHDSQPPNWESKLIDRIARELGNLVNQLAEYEGSAFNTYRGADGQKIEFATPPRNISHQPSLRQRKRNEKARADDSLTKPDGLFTPTVPQGPLTPGTEPADTSLWGIEEEPEQPTDEETTRSQQEREYWEQNVDIKMIFTYLKDRLSGNDSAQPSPEPPSSSSLLPASWATTTTTTTSESLRRAELIRRQHPLVSRAADRAAEIHRKRESLLRVQKRSGDIASSCASQSTKRSRKSLRSGGGSSSRHFWDLGGNNEVGGNSSIVSGSGEQGLGGWGEV